MAEPAAVRAALGFQTQLAGADYETILAMTRRWGAVESNLQAAIDALADEIAALSAAGESVPAWKIYNLERYQDLLAQIGRQVTSYMQWAFGELKAEGLKAQQLAQEHAKEMMALQAGADYSRLDLAPDKLGVSPAEKIAGLAEAGQPLEQILANAYPAAVNAITNKLVSGAALGWNPRKTAREIMRNGGLDLVLSHVLLVARDQQNRNYREAQRDTYQASQLVYGYKRLAAKNDRTCMACLRLDGMVFPKADVMPLHPQDRCTMIPLIVGRPIPEWETGLEWFKKQSAKTQIKMMGPGRYKAWKDDKFDLKNIATIKPHPIWGPNAQETSLKALLNGGGGLNGYPIHDPKDLADTHEAVITLLAPAPKARTVNIDQSMLGDLAKEAQKLPPTTAAALAGGIDIAADNLGKGAGVSTAYFDDNGNLSGLISYEPTPKGIRINKADFVDQGTQLRAIQELAKAAKPGGMEAYRITPDQRSTWLELGFEPYKADANGFTLRASPLIVNNLAENPAAFRETLLEIYNDNLTNSLSDPTKTANFLSGLAADNTPYKITTLTDVEIPSLKADLDEEPPPDIPPGKHLGAGMILYDPKTGRTVLSTPSNKFGPTTWPKGTVEAGEDLQAAAIREVFEETGFKARIVDVLGDYQGKTSINRFYIGIIEDGAPWGGHWETEAVDLIKPDLASKLLSQKTDRRIAQDFDALVTNALYLGKGNFEAGIKKAQAETAEEKAAMAWLEALAANQVEKDPLTSPEKLRLAAADAKKKGDMVKWEEYNIDAADMEAAAKEAKKAAPAEVEKAKELYAEFWAYGPGILDAWPMADVRSLKTYAYENGKPANELADIEAVIATRKEAQALAEPVEFPATLKTKNDIVFYLVETTGATKWKLAQLSKNQLEELNGKSKTAVLEAAELGAAQYNNAKTAKVMAAELAAEEEKKANAVYFPADLADGTKNQLVKYLVDTTGVTKWKIAQLSKADIQALGGQDKAAVFAAAEKGAEQYNAAKQAKKEAGIETPADKAVRAILGDGKFTSEMVEDHYAAAAFTGQKPSDMAQVDKGDLVGKNQVDAAQAAAQKAANQKAETETWAWSNTTDDPVKVKAYFDGKTLAELEELDGADPDYKTPKFSQAIKNAIAEKKAALSQPPAEAKSPATAIAQAAAMATAEITAQKIASGKAIFEGMKAGTIPSAYFDMVLAIGPKGVEDLLAYEATGASHILTNVKGSINFILNTIAQVKLIPANPVDAKKLTKAQIANDLAPVLAGTLFPDYSGQADKLSKYLESAYSKKALAGLYENLAQWKIDQAEAGDQAPKKSTVYDNAALRNIVYRPMTDDPAAYQKLTKYYLETTSGKYDLKGFNLKQKSLLWQLAQKGGQYDLAKQIETALILDHSGAVPTTGKLNLTPWDLLDIVVPTLTPEVLSAGDIQKLKIATDQGEIKPGMFFKLSMDQALEKISLQGPPEEAPKSGFDKLSYSQAELDLLIAANGDVKESFEQYGEIDLTPTNSYKLAQIITAVPTSNKGYNQALIDKAAKDMLFLAKEVEEEDPADLLVSDDLIHLTAKAIYTIPSKYKQWPPVALQVALEEGIKTLGENHAYLIGIKEALAQTMPLSPANVPLKEDQEEAAKKPEIIKLFEGKLLDGLKPTTTIQFTNLLKENWQESHANLATTYVKDLANISATIKALPTWPIADDPQFNKEITQALTATLIAYANDNDLDPYKKSPAQVANDPIKLLALAMNTDDQLLESWPPELLTKATNYAETILPSDSVWVEDLQAAKLIQRNKMAEQGIEEPAPEPVKKATILFVPKADQIETLSWILGAEVEDSTLKASTSLVLADMADSLGQVPPALQEFFDTLENAPKDYVSKLDPDSIVEAFSVAISALGDFDNLPEFNHPSILALADLPTLQAAADYLKYSPEKSANLGNLAEEINTAIQLKKNGPGELPPEPVKKPFTIDSNQAQDLGNILDGYLIDNPGYLSKGSKYLLAQMAGTMGFIPEGLDQSWEYIEKNPNVLEAIDLTDTFFAFHSALEALSGQMDGLDKASILTLFPIGILEKAAGEIEKNPFYLDGLDKDLEAAIDQALEFKKQKNALDLQTLEQTAADAKKASGKQFSELIDKNPDFLTPFQKDYLAYFAKQNLDQIPVSLIGYGTEPVNVSDPNELAKILGIIWSNTEDPEIMALVPHKDLTKVFFHMLDFPDKYIEKYVDTVEEALNISAAKLKAEKEKLLSQPPAKTVADLPEKDQKIVNNLDNIFGALNKDPKTPEATLQYLNWYSKNNYGIELPTSAISYRGKIGSEKPSKIQAKYLKDTAIYLLEEGKLSGGDPLAIKLLAQMGAVDLITVKDWMLEFTNFDTEIAYINKAILSLDEKADGSEIVKKAVGLPGDPEKGAATYEEAKKIPFNLAILKFEPADFEDMTAYLYKKNGSFPPVVEKWDKILAAMADAEPPSKTAVNQMTKAELVEFLTPIAATYSPNPAFILKGTPVSTLKITIKNIIDWKKQGGKAPIVKIYQDQPTADPNAGFPADAEPKLPADTEPIVSKVKVATRGTVEVTGPTAKFGIELKKKAEQSFTLAGPGTFASSKGAGYLGSANKALGNIIDNGAKGMIYLDDSGKMIGVAAYFNKDTELVMSGGAFAFPDIQAKAIADAIILADNQGQTFKMWVPDAWQSTYAGWGFKKESSNYMVIDKSTASPELLKNGSVEIQRQSDIGPIPMPAGAKTIAEAAKLPKKDLVEHLAKHTGVPLSKLSVLEKDDLASFIGQQAGDKIDKLIAKREAEKELKSYFAKWELGGIKSISHSSQGYKVLEYLQSPAGKKEKIDPGQIEAIRVHTEELRADERSRVPFSPAPNVRPMPELPAKAQLPTYKDFPTEPAKLKRVKSLGGSTGAELVEDPATGKQYIRKQGGKPGHVANEVYADEMYRAAGFNVPRAQFYEVNGQPVKLSEYIPNSRPIGQALRSASPDEKERLKAQIKGAFAMDALTGNWDVIGAEFDNMLVDEKGTVWRIDNGGTMRYRAQGKLKNDENPNDWNGWITDFWSMRAETRGGGALANSGPIFRELSWYEIMDQAADLVAKAPDLMAKLPPQERAIMWQRVEHLRDMVETTKAMQVDGMVDNFPDRLHFHSTNMKQDGLIEKIPQKMISNESSGRVYVKDQNGKAWDSLRGKNSFVTFVSNYMSRQGNDQGILAEYFSSQSGSSWNALPEAIKYHQYLSMGKPGNMYWHHGINSAKANYDKLVQRVGGEEQANELILSWRAGIFESVRRMDYKYNHPDQGYIQLGRTEPKTAVAGRKKDLGRWQEPIARGPMDSGSIYQTVVVGGHELTLQKVPYHRIMAYYWHSPRADASENNSPLYGDRENEFVADYSNLPFIYAGHVDAGENMDRYWEQAARELGEPELDPKSRKI